MRRRLMPAVVAIAVAVALSGCSVIGDIGRTGESLARGAAIDLALSQATEQLEALQGVTVTTSSSELNLDYDYSVYLAASVADASTEDLGAILEIVRSTLSGNAFSGYRYFDLTSGDESVASIGYFGLSAGQLADEVAYLGAYREAYGSPVSLGISEAMEAHASYARLIQPTDLSVFPNVTDLAAVPDPSTAEKTWTLPGLDVQGAFPSAAVMTLLSDITAVATLADYSSIDGFDGVHLQWYGSGRLDIGYTSSSLVEGVPFTETTDWPSFVAVTALATAADVPLHYLSYYNPVGLPGGSVNLGGCAGEGTPAVGDLELLAATGLDASAGYCYRESD